MNLDGVVTLEHGLFLLFLLFLTIVAKQSPTHVYNLHFPPCQFLFFTSLASSVECRVFGSRCPLCLVLLWKKKNVAPSNFHFLVDQVYDCHAY